MTVLLCSVFSILRYKEHRNILYLTWTGSSNPQLFRTGPHTLVCAYNNIYPLTRAYNNIYAFTRAYNKIYAQLYSHTNSRALGQFLKLQLKSI